MSKSVEQKLFEAFQKSSGLRLSYDDVLRLMNDDAIATRITSVACMEAGVSEPDGESIQLNETWGQFKERLIRWHHGYE